jgi:cytochrome c553
MKKTKLLRKIFCLIHATCLALILWINSSPAPAIAGIRDIIDPDNTQEANAERRAVREERVRQNVERDVKNESESFREHLRRANGDFAKGLITDFPPGSFAVSNAVKEVAKGCATCHQPELVAKIRATLEKLGTSGQAERDKQKVLQRIRDWEASNPPSRPAPTAPTRGPSSGGGRNGGE